MEAKHKILYIGSSGELYDALAAEFDIVNCDCTVNSVKLRLGFGSLKLIIFNLTEDPFLALNVMQYLSMERITIPIIVKCDEEFQAENAALFKACNATAVVGYVAKSGVVSYCKSRIEGELQGEVSSVVSVEDIPVNRTTVPHVLLVDDNPIVLRTTKDMLEPRYTVSIAVSSDQAFMVMRKRKPDVILLDYEMPVVNGEAMVRMLEKTKEFANIPIIFFTSAADGDTVRKLLQLRPAGYILKPPNKDLMIGLIEKALTEKRR